MEAVVPPTERICERCGRHDVWDDQRETWAIAEEDGEKAVGNPQCIHDWDINGTYNPLSE